ncbi:HTTM domain-containing protein [Mucilaginibacter sp. CAU 1740]|uniref:HTTM domain-containing protein n=1 Tax=Mucilaginibacter sp. CAU 1740 TaxID=3140365 RepID=UPI00325AB60B
MNISAFFKAKAKHLQQPVSAAPLATFRVLFGLMMLAGTIRFWLNGWIDDLYVKPGFYFSYMGFEWVRPLGNTGMHLLFGVMLLATVLVAIGLFYRVAIVVFFLSFTYIELIDVTNYLNHYYFISLVAFLMIWLPAAGMFSVDARLKPKQKVPYVPLWMVGIIRLQLGVVYFFAGLAKLNVDWMLDAIPMKIWLPAKSHLPIVGELMYKDWVAYFFSWFGAVYDLFIVFFMANHRSRPWAFIVVIGFHVCTAIFFPSIGMFPYVMMLSSLVFFSSVTHQKVIDFIAGNKADTLTSHDYKANASSGLKWMFMAYLVLQVIVPLRFLAYPDSLFWNEEGYRFSWRVMLMEKSGNTFFYVKEPSTGKTFEVNNSEFLTPLQDKMMSTQPDMILRYAHYLASVYQKRGIKQPAVYADCYVTLNGRRSRQFIDTTVNLASQPLSWQHYNWVLPYNLK